MDNNPYRAPRTPLKDAPLAPRSPILAVSVGLAVDVGGTFLASAVIGAVLVGRLFAEDMAPEQLEEALRQQAPGYAIVATAMGAAFSLLGGYVCARIVRRRERHSAAALGTLSGAIGLAFAGPFGAWINLALSLLTFVVVMLGAELGRSHNFAGARAGVSSAE